MEAIVASGTNEFAVVTKSSRESLRKQFFAIKDFHNIACLLGVQKIGAEGPHRHTESERNFPHGIIRRRILERQSFARK